MRNPYYNSNSLYSYHSPYNSTPAFSYSHSYNHSYHQNRADLVEAGASLGFVGSGAALMTGKVSASLVGAKLAAAGLAIGSGGMIPLIGAIATLGMGILAGAMGLKAAKTIGKEGIRGLEYLGERAAVNTYRLTNSTTKLLGTMAVKGAKVSFKYAKKATNSLLNKSKESIHKNMQQPQQLLGNYSQSPQIEKNFIDRLNTLNKAIKKGKDIKTDLKDIFKYKIPTQKSLKALQNTTSYYFIKQNADKNNGKINLKEIQKDFKKFSKEIGLNRKEAKLFQSHIPKTVEKLKDNLIITKDNQLAPFKFNIHQSTQQINKQKSQKMQQKFERNQINKTKGKTQGKQQMQQQLQPTKEKENISFGR